MERISILKNTDKDTLKNKWPKSTWDISEIKKGCRGKGIFVS